MAKGLQRLFLNLFLIVMALPLMFIQLRTSLTLMSVFNSTLKIFPIRNYWNILDTVRGKITEN